MGGSIANWTVTKTVIVWDLLYGYSSILFLGKMLQFDE